jgi:hypothetical protein
VSAGGPDALPGSVLLCYCTGLTMADLREGCRVERWPPAGKERTGKLCTGCMGDLLYCLRVFEVPGRESRRGPPED